ncbi:MAG TPA: oligosaccharide flippase family protein [Candidatus Thermoplasmatota archaeon]|nr:oligosaccharide flippase family protein [Candidatus Thermoplasmatota archaeon]
MIARQSTVVLMDNILGALQGFLALFVIARYMGDQVLGERAFALALVSLVGIVARLGLPTTHVRRLARGEDVGASNGAFLQLKAGLTALFMVLAGLAAFAWFELLHKGTSDTTPFALWVAFWIVVVQSLRDVPVATFQGLRYIVEREAVLFTNTVVTVVLTVLAGIAYADSHGRWSPLPDFGHSVANLLGVHAPMSPDSGVALLMLAFFAGEVAAFLLAIALFARRRIPIRRPARGLMPEYLRFTVPLMLLAVGEVCTKWLSQVLLGFWWDAATLGQFAAAAKLSELFLLLGSSLAIVLLPAISLLHAQGDEGGVLRVVRDVERWTSLLLWPVIVLVVWANGPLVHILLSDRFARAGPVLVILCLQALATSLLMPVQNLAIASGKPGFAARVILASVGVGFLLNLGLVPDRLGPLPALGLDAVGAALAALGATLFALVAYSVRTRGWAGHSFVQKHLGLHVLAAAVTLGLLVLLRIPLPGRFFQLPLYALGIAAAYALLLSAFGELRREDWRRFAALLSPQTAKKP